MGKKWEMPRLKARHPPSVRPRSIGEIGALVRGAGAEGPRRAADGGRPVLCAGQVEKPCSPLGTHAGPAAPHEGAAGAWVAEVALRLGAQHHAYWGGPCAAANRAGRVGNSRCFKMARTPLGAVTYASTRRRPPHLTRAKTSSAKVRRSSPAQSTRGVRSFFASAFATASGGGLASCGFGPAHAPTLGGAEMAGVSRLERRRRGTS